MKSDRPSRSRPYAAPVLTRHGDVGSLTQNVKQAQGNFDGSVALGKSLKTA